jgi:hypothetical protein
MHDVTKRIEPVACNADLQLSLAKGKKIRNQKRTQSNSRIKIIKVTKSITYLIHKDCEQIHLLYTVQHNYRTRMYVFQGVKISNHIN